MGGLCKCVELRDLAIEWVTGISQYVRHHR
jgi:hypothetical protein